ncbi:unnamed protein product, partial [Mesorhabditis spiculigera]
MCDREVLAIAQLGLAFLSVLTAFNGQGFIEVAILKDLAEDPTSGVTSNSGYYSLALIYTSMSIFNIICPTIINKLGPKWPMAIGSLFYIVFMLGFMKISLYMLYFLSALLGIGASLMWTASGVFLVEFSSPGNLQRNTGILWSLIQTSHFVGGGCILIGLKDHDLKSGYIMIYMIFAALGAVSVFLYAALPNRPFHVGKALPCNTKEEITIMGDLKKMGNLVCAPKMYGSLLMFLYMGMETTFSNTVFTTCVTSTRQLSEGKEEIVAYLILSMSLGHVLGSIFLGIWAPFPEKFGIRWIVILGLVLHYVAFILSYLVFPASAPLGKTWEIGPMEPRMDIYVLVSFLLGVASACWHTQSMVMIGDIFVGSELPAAFALYKLFQTVAASAVYIYSAHLLLHWQLIIASIFGFFGLWFFLVVHKSATEEENIKRNRLP